MKYTRARENDLNMGAVKTTWPPMARHAKPAPEAFAAARAAAGGPRPEQVLHVKFIKCPSPLNMRKYKYDHSCY